MAQSATTTRDILNHDRPRRLNVAVIGIGRIGRQHALNALYFSPRTHLLSVCSPMPADLEWAAEHLVPHGVHAYKTFEETIAEPGLEAVIIASTTKFHYEHVKTCIERGLHVLCEKPLAMTWAQAREVADLAGKVSKEKGVKVMTAFCRRFEASYANARKMVEGGKIGAPVVIRSQTADKFDRSEFYMRYVMSNPGIFIDTGVHDIDLTLSFFGADARPKACWATGTTALHKEVEKIQDVDNAVGCVEWYPTKASKGVSPLSYYFFSRIFHHGFDNPTEVIGTEGVLKINLHPKRDLITTADASGIGNDCSPDFYDRYERAIVEELRIFADAVLDDTKLPYEVDVAVKGMEVAEALQESLRTGKKIEWDENGQRKSRSGELVSKL